MNPDIKVVAGVLRYPLTGFVVINPAEAIRTKKFGRNPDTRMYLGIRSLIAFHMHQPPIPPFRSPMTPYAGEILATRVCPMQSKK